jgi:ATP-dependent Clp protease ATP-binding subunit ClpC
MQLANQEAQRFNHEYVGTEHILLGLIKEGSGVAANALKNLDIDLRKIRQEVEKIVQSGPEMVTMGHLPQTPRAKKVIEYAIEEARGLNHNYVGTEHLLLGLLREQEGVAAQVLMNLGTNLEGVREEVLKLLGTSTLPRDEKSGICVAPASSKPKTPVLDGFSRDLTDLARQGKLDRPAGWSELYEAAFAVLGCQERNNLLVVGEPGVGKTHFLHGLALQALEGPLPLQQYRLVAVDPTQLCLAQRKAALALLNEARRDGDIVLVLDDVAAFVDPDRCLVGYAASKLFRGCLGLPGVRMIATATPAYYESVLKTDEVIGPRFQVLRLVPPSAEETIKVLQCVRLRHEAHHGGRIKDEALEAAVQLSACGSERAFPGKAVELLDRACARTRLRSVSRTPDLKELDGQIDQLNLQKEAAIVAQDFEKAAFLRDQGDKLRKCKVTILQAWQEALKDNQGVVDAEAVAAVVQRPW